MNIKILLDPISSYISEKYKKALELKNDSENISLRILHQRELYISELDSTISKIADLVKDSTNKLSNLRQFHDDEINDFKLLLNTLNSEFKPVSTKFKYAPGKESKQTIINTPTQIKKFVTDKHYLNAVSVNNWEELSNMESGILYYVETANHFAIKLNGVVMHGNIGKIYVNESEPVKVKNCMFGTKCMKEKCNFYHNPSTTGGNDVRNYVANSFTYVPPGSIQRNRKKLRHIGSIDELESDLESIPPDESEKFIDQTMHDLLCALLLQQNQS